MNNSELFGGEYCSRFFALAMAAVVPMGCLAQYDEIVTTFTLAGDRLLMEMSGFTPGACDFFYWVSGNRYRSLVPSTRATKK